MFCIVYTGCTAHCFCCKSVFPESRFTPCTALATPWALDWNVGHLAAGQIQGAKGIHAVCDSPSGFCLRCSSNKRRTVHHAICSIAPCHLWFVRLCERVIRAQAKVPLCQLSSVVPCAEPDVNRTPLPPHPSPSHHDISSERFLLILYCCG